MVMVMVMVMVMMMVMVVHCDIKPENIIVNDGGELFVIDFGVSSLITDLSSKHNANILVGTSAYGPTSFDSEQPSRPSDDYESLAFTLHALRVGTTNRKNLVLAGRKPSFSSLLDSDSLVEAIIKPKALETNEPLGNTHRFALLGIGVSAAALSASILIPLLVKPTGGDTLRCANSFL